MTTATKSRKSAKSAESATVPTTVPVVPTTEQRVEQSGALENIMSSVEQSPAEKLAYLKAEKKRIAEEEKALKATLPNLTAIDRTIARQAEQFNKWVPDNLANRILARMKAGQDRKAATSQVVEFYLKMMNDLLDEREQKLHTDEQ